LPGLTSRSIRRTVALNSKSPVLKLFFGRLVVYFKFVIVFVAVASAGLLMGGQGLTQKQKLEENLNLLHKENGRLVGEIKTLERRVTLLRSDPKTIEKVAKRNLGMARPDETVFVFQKDESATSISSLSEGGLAKDGNLP
jgi:cell division protein FtsB